MSAKKYYVGEKYNRLLVTAQYVKDKKRTICVCLCDCGNVKEVMAYKLTSNQTKSCGCLNKEKLRNRMYKHGQSDTRLYRKWRSMLNRCENSNEPRYKYYGERGIKVCDEWKEYINFYSWAMNSGYIEGLTIDRIDVNGNYEPSNCRWATVKEQALNRRNNHLLEFNGEVKTLKEWQDEYGINRTTLMNRLERGWSIEKALTFPICENRRNHKAKDISKGVDKNVELE